MIINPLYSSSSYLTPIAEKKAVVEMSPTSKWQSASNVLIGTVAAIGIGCIAAAAKKSDPTALSEIPVRYLPHQSGLCPVTDPYHQFNIANYLSGHVTQHIESLTDLARVSSYDTFNKPDGNAFRYGISQGNQCLRREWGDKLSQFDSLTPTDDDQGFEFKRSYEGRIGLILKCTKKKNDLNCASFFNNKFSYEAHEDRNKVVEKLCVNKICERVTTPKNQPTPLLLNKLLHITNKA